MIRISGSIEEVTNCIENLERKEIEAYKTLCVGWRDDMSFEDIKNKVKLEIHYSKGWIKHTMPSFYNSQDYKEEYKVKGNVFNEVIYIYEPSLEYGCKFAHNIKEN